MAKGKLEYDLTDFDDLQAFNISVKSKDFYLVLYDLDQRLRTLERYEHDYKTVDEVVHHIRDKLNEYMLDHDISFDMLR